MQYEFKNSFGNTFLLTKFDPGNNWIYNDWQGLLSMEGIVEGCAGMLNILRHTHCPYMLNDNTRLQGSWKHANDWLATTLVPQVVEAGLRYYAHVAAPGVFGQASAEDLHLRVGTTFEMRIFETLEEAQEWLRDMQHQNQPAT
ncbi:hypothetical protein [Hymenobacter metallilatus]|uniref:STAS/SEC14 domain-containing protein n=1 Tax=Hymenobacter metallilatus TaxID=2493666 RepID=A0A3R9NCN3_9BACT|nr:hypothetical protein [Hymenobacter metallilatus]RSK25237.1 hypothetical protein EI290_17600 [Hymenobacter metallilatus]